MTPIEFISEDGNKYLIELTGKESIAIHDNSGNFAYDRWIIDGKIDWPIENKIGRCQTPLDIRRFADKLIANKVFL